MGPKAAISRPAPRAAMKSAGAGRLSFRGSTNRRGRALSAGSFVLCLQRRRSRRSTHGSEIATGMRMRARVRRVALVHSRARNSPWIAGTRAVSDLVAGARRCRGSYVHRLRALDVRADGLEYHGFCSARGTAMNSGRPRRLRDRRSNVGFPVAETSRR
jgi:hypothetical protein